MQRADAYERRFPRQLETSGSAGASNSHGMTPSNGRHTGHTSLNGNGSNTQASGYYSDRLPTSTEEGALYTVDHLATFTVGESYELVYPKDGLRRLRQMEKSSGIWTQRMYLRLESNWLVIIDYENGDIVERFPLELLSDPTSFISQDPKELYNNILLFTIKEDPRAKTSISEMHIFHCLKTSAEKIADDVSMLIRAVGKGSAQVSKRNKDAVIIPPPPNNPPPEPPSNGSSVKAKVDIFNHIVVDPRRDRKLENGMYDVGEGVKTRQEQMIATSFHPEDDNDSQRSDSTTYERDVAILNRCFDDIERFIARLQYASAAYKELDRRRRQRKSKKKEAGDGMLIIRSRPPAETEFVDIFQKFKLSFNLLGKLRSHIHDPNAPELIHFLFTPLALVVDASHDAEYGPNLASRIVPPLLAPEAKQLLLNCLTSKESDLWHSLGEAWTTTRDDWPGYVPAYVPTFHDGWEPNLHYADQEKHRLQNGASSTRVESWKDDRNREFERDSQGYSAEYSYHEQRGDFRKGTTPSPSPRQYSERDRNSEISDGAFTDNDFERRQRRFAAELEMHNAKIVQVVYSRAGKNDKELTVQRGEVLEVVNDTRKWWQTKNNRGQTGYVPNTIVIPYRSVDSADDAYASYPPSQRNHNVRGGYSD